MIYRVNLYDDADGSRGFAFFGNARDAGKRLDDWRAESPDTRREADVDVAPTPTTKAAMIALLGRWGGEPQNG